MAKQKAVFDDINITPLTDIFLVLLIIMMVVAPMLDTTGLNLANPSVEAVPDQKEDPEVITLKVSDADKLFVEGEFAGPLSIRNRLRDLKKEKPDGILIQAHPESSHQGLTSAIDAAQSAGITTIGIQKDPDASSSSGDS